jgi:hypothetical protein
MTRALPGAWSFQKGAEMRSPRPTRVQVEVSLSLVVPEGSALPVQASLRYEPKDPYAVHVVFHAGDEPGAEVSWSFARQLLVDGMREPAGMGDVRVWPWLGDEGPVAALALSSPDGHALFEVPRQSLETFLASTYTQVPLGAEGEHLDLDATLANLLGASGSESR